MPTIRELRLAKGWTQLALANALSVTPSTVHNWESGRYVPKVQQLRQLAQTFGVSSDDIKLAEPRPKQARLPSA